jgi:hypothetical protein
MSIENPNQNQSPKSETMQLGDKTVTRKKLRGQGESDPAVIKAKADADEWVKGRFMARPEHLEENIEILEDLPEGMSTEGLIMMGDRLIDKKTGKQYKMPKLAKR